MRGRINKEMAEKLKKESLGLESNGNQPTLEIDCEGEKEIKNGRNFFW
jgi:hypothetical protein